MADQTSLEAFVAQIARMTLPEEEFEASAKLQSRYDDADDYESDLSDDRLLDEFAALKDLIRTARTFTPIIQEQPHG